MLGRGRCRPTGVLGVDEGGFGFGYQNAAQCTILQGGGEAPFRPSGRTHLLFDVLAQDGDGGTTHRSGEVRARPEPLRSPVVASKLRELLAQQSRRHAFERVDELGDGNRGWVVHEQVDMLGLTVELDELGPEVFAYITEDRFQPSEVASRKHSVAVLGDEDQVRVQHEYAVATSADI